MTGKDKWRMIGWQTTGIWQDPEALEALSLVLTPAVSEAFWWYFPAS